MYMQSDLESHSHNNSESLVFWTQDYKTNCNQYVRMMPPRCWCAIRKGHKEKTGQMERWG